MKYAHSKDWVLLGRPGDVVPDDALPIGSGVLPASDSRVVAVLKRRAEHAELRKRMKMAGRRWTGECYE